MSDGIAYQNKDIEFKLISETFKEKSFEAYGLNLPKIKAVLPTNLPKVSANEKRMDHLFLLEDDTVAIVDYEAEDKLANRVKYVNYIARVMERYMKDSGMIPDLRMIVIYTGDVEHADNVLETKCFRLNMEHVFVSHLPGEEIYQEIKHKLENGERLTEQEFMRLIILPLAEKGKEKKQKRVEEVVELAKMIEDEQGQVFVIAGVLVCSDKFIDRDYAKGIRRYLGMTKVFQLFEEEKQEAVLQAAKAAAQKEKQQTAVRMLEGGEDFGSIMMYTRLTKEEIEEIRQNMPVIQ
ncbi:MAG: hypothetical protein HFG83_00790 [Dorea sp.]|nr:hypothetical protein [Dorea sp.]